jgi:hypothetical protein
MLTCEQIWQSLGFYVTSIETGPSDHRASSWTLSLDYNEHIVSPEKLKLHKLSPDIPYHDMKPPPGVHVVKIEAFRVRILLKKPPTTIALRHGLSRCDGIAHEDESATFDSESLFQNSASADEGQPCFDIDAKFRNSDRMQCSTISEDNFVLQSHITPIADSRCAYLTPPSSQDREEHDRTESATGPIQRVADHVCTETLLSCLEIGLRHVMCKSSSRKSKANTIVSNEDFKCLPIIAPALWVPEYHQAVSERAAFLPTISRSIANVSKHSSTNIGLGTKVWQLSHRHPNMSREIFPMSAATKATDIQEALSANLWTAMTAELNDTRTARQPRSSRDNFNSTRDMDTLTEVEDMLDEFAADDDSDDSDGMCSDSDLEDLLSVAIKTDEDSMCNWSGSDIGHMSECSTEALDIYPPDRWDMEHPSPLDSPCDMVGDGPELDESDSCGVVGARDGEGGGSIGIQCGFSQRWDGLDYAHDSATVQFSRMESEGFEVDETLLWDLEDVGAES